MSWKNGSSTAEKVFLYLVEVGGMTKAGAAGVLGNMEHESGVIPNRVQMGYGWTDSAYTSAVDSGSYSNFVYDSIGYGLVQFTYWTLKKQVYDKAKSRGTSVGDLETQLICVVNALKTSYSDLYSTLKTSNNVRTCCVAFLLQYERPADQSYAVQNKRTQAAQSYYDRFKNSNASQGSDSGSSGSESPGSGVTTTTTTVSFSYDRKKDPLLLEFGYASKVSNKANANLGTSIRASKSKSSYPLSAMNMAELMNDVFEVFGIDASSTSSGSAEFSESGSGSQPSSGKAVAKSGKTITSGTKKTVPYGVSQTGIIANYTGYNQNWTQGTTQRTLYNLWKSSGSKTNHSVCTLNGYYLLAPGRYFSNSCGDMLEWELEDGTKFMSIVADTKGSDTPSEYGHLFGGSADIIEWESVASQSELQSGLRSWGIYGKKVTSCVNYGTWFQ